jgi:hypothetical protein
MLIVYKIFMDYCALGSLRDALELAGRPLKEKEIATVCASALEGTVVVACGSCRGYVGL